MDKIKILNKHRLQNWNKNDKRLKKQKKVENKMKRLT